MLYEISCGRPPFSDSDQVQMFQNICNVKYKFPSFFSPVRSFAAVIAAGPMSGCWWRQCIAVA